MNDHHYHDAEWPMPPPQYNYHKPNNFLCHKMVPQRGGGILNLPHPQNGAGLGNLFRSFFNWIAPVGKSILKSGITTGKQLAKTGIKTGKQVAKSKLVKDAAKAFKRDAVNAGIDVAQTALSGGDIKKTFDDQTKQIKRNLTENISNSLENYRPNTNNSRSYPRQPPPKKKKKKVGVIANIRSKKRVKDNLD